MLAVIQAIMYCILSCPDHQYKIIKHKEFDKNQIKFHALVEKGPQSQNDKWSLMISHI